MGEGLASLTVARLLEELGARTPTPGGGAAAGLAGALAASLARMVVEYSIGKKSLLEHQDFLVRSRSELDTLRAAFLGAADADAVAYSRLNSLQRLAPDDPARAGLAVAVREAAAVPRGIMTRGDELLTLVTQLVGRTSKGLRSDLAISGVLAEAAVVAGALNVMANLPFLPEGEQASMAAGARDGMAGAAAKRGVIERACA